MVETITARKHAAFAQHSAALAGAACHTPVTRSRARARQSALTAVASAAIRINVARLQAPVHGMRGATSPACGVHHVARATALHNPRPSARTNCRSARVQALSPPAFIINPAPRCQHHAQPKQPRHRCDQVACCSRAVQIAVSTRAHVEKLELAHCMSLDCHENRSIRLDLISDSIYIITRPGHLGTGIPLSRELHAAVISRRRVTREANLGAQ